MAFTADDFTDTAATVLTSHTPSGTGAAGTWSTAPSSSAAHITSGGRAATSSSATCWNYLSTTPPSADYTVQADIVALTKVNYSYAGVMGRFVGSSATGLMAYIDCDGTTFTLGLYRYGGSGDGSLGTYTIGTTAATWSVKLEMIGTAIKVYLDGTERISVTETSITAASKVGIRIGTNTTISDSTAIQVDNLTTTSPSVSITSPALAVSASSPAPVVQVTVDDQLTEASATELSLHTSAATWTRHTSYDSGTTPRITVGTSGTAYQSASGGSGDAAYTTPVTPNADGYAVADVYIASTGATSFAALGLRCATGSISGLMAIVDTGGFSGANVLRLYRYGGSGTASLGTYSTTFTAGQTYRVKLECIGTAIKVYLDGVERISVTESSITSGSMLARLGNGSSSTGVHFDRLMYLTEASGTTVVSPALAVSAALPAPTVTATSPNVTVTSPALAVAAAARAPTLSIVPGTGTVSLSGSRVLVADSTSTGHSFNGFNGYCVTQAGTHLVNFDVADTEASGPDYGSKIRRSTDGGATWSTAKTFDLIAGDCSMYTATNGTIYAIWVNVNPGTPPITVATVFNNYWSKSTDDGVTWSTPAVLDGGAVPARASDGTGSYTLAASPPVQAPDGKYLLPVYRRSTTSSSDLDFYVVCREYDADFTNGATRGTPFPYVSGWRFEEACFTYRPDGALLCAARTTEPSNYPTIWMNVSYDHGTTWGTAQRVLGTGASTNGWGGRANIWTSPEGLLFILLRKMVSGLSDATAYSTSTDGFTWATPTELASSSVSVYGAWATINVAGTQPSVAAVYGVQNPGNTGKLYLQKFDTGMVIIDPPALAVSAALPVPTITTSVGSQNATITAVPLAVSVALPPPTVATGTGATITAVPLAVAGTLPSPIVVTTIGVVTIVVPPLAVAVTLAAPNNASDTGYLWFRTRRRTMSAPTKTYVQVIPKGTTRTSSYTSPTYEARTEAGILVVLDVTSASGTGGLTLRINAHDQASSQAVALNAAPTAVTAAGTTSYALYPFGAIAGNVTQATSFYLPRLFSISVSHGDSSSYTYSVGFCLLP